MKINFHRKGIGQKNINDIKLLKMKNIFLNKEDMGHIHFVT